MDDHVPIGLLAVRCLATTMVAPSSEQRYVAIALSSQPERQAQRVLTICTDGHDGRRSTFIGTTSFTGDGLWRMLWEG